MCTSASQGWGRDGRRPLRAQSLAVSAGVGWLKKYARERAAGIGANARGGLLKLKTSPMLAARTSVVPSDPSSQFFSMNFRMLPNSYCVCDR